MANARTFAQNPPSNNSCQYHNLLISSDKNRFGGAGGLMDDTVCGGGIVQTSRGLCSLARVSTALA